MSGLLCLCYTVYSVDVKLSPHIVAQKHLQYSSEYTSSKDTSSSNEIHD